MSVQTKNGRSVRAHIQYRNKENIRLPGVTTVLGILAKPALIYWAWDLGMQKIDYRKFRDDKADIGTLAHEMALAHLRNEKPETTGYSSDQIELAEICFSKYLNWEKEHKIKPILLEKPLISETYQFGGTIDNYCKLDGVLTLVDYKTSKGIYEEMFYQVAAYKQLLVENNFNVQDVRILRIGRNEDEGFEDRKMINVSKHFFIFQSCLEIYNLRKQIKEK